MRVIVLNGASETGKTTALKELYTVLKKDGAKDIFPPHCCHCSLSDMEYYVCYNGKHIGIVTMGDYALETIWYLGVYYGRYADILVIANNKSPLPFYKMQHHGLEYSEVSKTRIGEPGIIDALLKKL